MYSKRQLDCINQSNINLVLNIKCHLTNSSKFEIPTVIPSSDKILLRKNGDNRNISFTIHAYRYDFYVRVKKHIDGNRHNTDDKIEDATSQSSRDMGHKFFGDVIHELISRYERRFRLNYGQK